MHEISQPPSTLETEQRTERKKTHAARRMALTSTSWQKVALEPYCSWHWWCVLYFTPGVASGVVRSFLDGRSSRQKPQPRLQHGIQGNKKSGY